MRGPSLRGGWTLALEVRHAIETIDPRADQLGERALVGREVWAASRRAAEIEERTGEKEGPLAV
jgi:hypothetical protein